MTSDQIDAFAKRLAFQAVELVGADEAPGTLLQALMLTMIEHHSLPAAVFCLERTVADLRRRAAGVGGAQ